jgi:PAS domain S-box-containing protein
MDKDNAVVKHIDDYRRLDLKDYKSFFEETPVALIRTELKTGRFLMANKFAAQLFGYETVEDLIVNACTLDFYPIEDRKKLIQILRKKGVVENHEIKLQVPDKQIYVSASFRINCEGNCIEGSLIDITEKVSLREKQLGLLTELGKKIDKKIASLAG